MDSHEHTHGKKHTKLVAVILILIALIIVFFTNNQSRDLNTPAEFIEELAYDGSATLGYAADEAMVKMENDFSPEVAKSRVAVAGSMIAPEFSDSSIPRDDVDARVIKNGSLSLNVPKVESEVTEIRNIAKVNGGDVMTANFNTLPNNAQSGWLTVKVPADKFDETLSAIKARATLVLNESVSTRDVTEEFVDTEAQLTNKKAHEERLRSFFERAESVEDLINVERELSRVRSEIERIEGRLKYLTNQTDFSTITVHLTEDAQIAANEGWRPGQVAKDAVNSLIAKFQDIVDGTITLVIASLPIFIGSLFGLWIIYLIGSKLVRFAMRKIEKRKHTE